MKTITTKKGKTVTLLNPNEKARKFADELRNKAKQTNDGYIKFDKSGKPAYLTEKESAFRSGYLEARRDSAKLYKWKKTRGYEK